MDDQQQDAARDWLSGGPPMADLEESAARRYRASRLLVSVVSRLDSKAAKEWKYMEIW